MRMDRTKLTTTKPPEKLKPQTSYKTICRPTCLLDQACCGGQHSADHESGLHAGAEIAVLVLILVVLVLVLAVLADGPDCGAPLAGGHA